MIEFENSIKKLSFLCHLLDINIAWIWISAKWGMDKPISLSHHLLVAFYFHKIGLKWYG